MSSASLTDLLRKRRRGFSFTLDGAVRCAKCGNRGSIPHHLSTTFWTFWTRAQLVALLQQMQPNERLAWISHRLVRLVAPDGAARVLRERDGAWSVEVNEEVTTKE